MSEPTKFLLGEGDVPTHWVNLMAELPGDVRVVSTAHIATQPVSSQR